MTKTTKILLFLIFLGYAGLYVLYYSHLHMQQFIIDAHQYQILILGEER